MRQMLNARVVWLVGAAHGPFGRLQVFGVVSRLIG
jgi:hypothetical protein